MCNDCQNNQESGFEHAGSRMEEYARSERVVGRLLEGVSLEEDFDAVVDKMLQIVGENFDVDRCYVFKYQGEGFSRLKKVSEWSRPALKEVLSDSEQMDERCFGGYQKKLLDHKPVLIEEAGGNESGGAEKSGCEKFHTRLLNGLWIGERLYGFIGFDHVRERENFSDSLVHIITCFSALFRLAYERAGQREELLESLMVQRQIMDNIKLPALLIDLNYHVLAVNPLKKIGAGLSPEQAVGTRCFNTICQYPCPPDFCPAKEALRTRKPFSKEFSFGDKRVIMVAQPIFGRNGDMRYILCIDIDITEVTRQKEELKKAMEQAQAANRAKSYFLATVSHELRTPLNAVIGFTELLRHGGIDEKTRQEYLNSISFAGSALLNLINDVLDLSSLEADQAQISPTMNDLAELVTRVVSVFRIKAAEKQLELSADVSDIPYMLNIDGVRLRQILLNLIGNAIKFTSKGGIKVKAVFLPEDKEYGSLTVSVSDTGIGIARENQDRIFEPFVHDSVIRGKWMYEGSGLGLTITRRLLDKMGGSIHLVSKPGEGSTFTIRLEKIRYEEAMEDTSSPENSKPLFSGKISGRKLRVLLVDDIPLNLKVLEAMLKLLNVESTLAASADSALEILRRDARYDMIMTDMWMPEVSGAELAERLRAESGVQIPIAAVTADTQISEKDRELFSYILYKPITLESLERMLEQFEASRKLS